MDDQRPAPSAFEPEAATDEPASPATHPASLDFDPVSTRHRIDGITPDKQREYVEALADTGVARVAAARIGVSEQAVGRLRRRADARSFNLACEAARRFGARRLHSIAWERAIEGTIRRHYYHGELKSEERVYDNRLLVYLLGRTEHLLDEPDEARAVAENWEPFVEAIEQGLPPPGVDDESEEEGQEEPDECERLIESIVVWQQGDGWWTSFPPPAGFDGEEGQPGSRDYCRTLSEDEQAVVDAWEASDRAEKVAREGACRDRYFGFEGGSAEEEVFSPREAEPYETSGQEPPGPIAEADRPDDKDAS
jgi:hypothetical protein